MNAYRFGRSFLFLTPLLFLTVPLSGCGAPDEASDGRANTLTEALHTHPALHVLAGQLGGSGNLDGRGVAARFSNPMGMTIDGRGNLFVADYYNNTIRKVVIDTGEVSTLAGVAGEVGYDDSTDGTGKTARFYNPTSVACDHAGNLFVADFNNDTIRKVVIATGEVSTLAGVAMQDGETDSTDDTGKTARFSEPGGITYDDAGNLFVTDFGANTVRKIVVATGAVTTLAGKALATGSTDGIGEAALFNSPSDITSDGAGNVFVVDSASYTIRKIVAATGEVTTLAGAAGQSAFADGSGQSARFASPGAIVYRHGALFVTDDQRKIRKVVIATGAVTTVPSTTEAPARGNYLYTPVYLGIAFDRHGNLFVTDEARVLKVLIANGTTTTLAGAASSADDIDGIGTDARFDVPWGITSDGGNLFVTDAWSGTIRKVVIASGEVTTVAGVAGQIGSRDSTDGTGRTAGFSWPSGITSDGAGNLFIADNGSHTIRKVVIASGETTTVAGSAAQDGFVDGASEAARFSSPKDVAYDGVGNLFVADAANAAVRKIALATGEVTTLATGFAYPAGLYCDRAGSLFVSDSQSGTINRIVLATGQVTTLAAGLSGLAGISGDGAGNLLVAANTRVHKVDLSTGAVTTVVGSPDSRGVRLGSLPAALRSPVGVVATAHGELFITDSVESAVLRVGAR